jgi:hypothetical protein
MTDREGIVGITDEGQPIVLPGYSCQNFALGAYPLLNQRICWYCRFSDFRKSADVMLKQSVCHCPKNAQGIQADGKDEGS